MPEITESLNLGDLLKYEAPNLYSRERITVLAGQHLVLGTVVGVVTATGKCRALDPAATDGSQIAAGVLLQHCNASLAERDDGLMVARHAIVAHHALTWPQDITAEAKSAAVAQLRALGVLVRQAV